jgi:hypothetical protein
MPVSVVNRHLLNMALMAPCMVAPSQKSSNLRTAQFQKTPMRSVAFLLFSAIVFCW